MEGQRRTRRTSQRKVNWITLRGDSKQAGKRGVRQLPASGSFSESAGLDRTGELHFTNPRSQNGHPRNPQSIFTSPAFTCSTRSRQHHLIFLTSAGRDEVHVVVVGHDSRLLLSTPQQQHYRVRTWKKSIGLNDKDGHHKNARNPPLQPNISIPAQSSPQRPSRSHGIATLRLPRPERALRPTPHPGNRRFKKESPNWNSTTRQSATTAAKVDAQAHSLGADHCRCDARSY